MEKMRKINLGKGYRVSKASGRLLENDRKMSAMFPKTWESRFWRNPPSQKSLRCWGNY